MRHAVLLIAICGLAACGDRTPKIPTGPITAGEIQSGIRADGGLPADVTAECVEATAVAISAQRGDPAIESDPAYVNEFERSIARAGLARDITDQAIAACRAGGGVQ